MAVVSATAGERDERARRVRAPGGRRTRRSSCCRLGSGCSPKRSDGPWTPPGRASSPTGSPDRRGDARAPDQGPAARLRDRDRGPADQRPARGDRLLHGLRHDPRSGPTRPIALASATGIIRSEVGRQHRPAAHPVARASSPTRCPTAPAGSRTWSPQARERRRASWPAAARAPIGPATPTRTASPPRTTGRRGRRRGRRGRGMTRTRMTAPAAWSSSTSPAA